MFKTRGTPVLIVAFCIGLLPAVGLAQAEPVITPWTHKQQRFAEALRGEPDVLFPEAEEETKFSGDKQPLSTIEAARAGMILKAKAKEEPQSALEELYSARIVDNLEQYGYDLFGVPNENTEQQLNSLAAQAGGMPMGAVQDDFILGSGDELEIMFAGQRTDRALYKVNSQGLITIEDFPPIPAAGRTLGQVRVSVEAAAKNLHNTETYVSLSSVRQIGVLVVGHVKTPGLKRMTSFHTVLDALMQSGGVQKTGSLRQIKLVRDGRSMIVDLYALLLNGSANMDLNLRDGDRIIIPAIGPTVAVAGEAKRTGIFEILPALKGMRHDPGKTSERLTLNEMLEFGGGVLTPGKNRYLMLGVTAEGLEQVEDIQEPFKPLFSDGSILMISKGTEKRAGTVELQGHTRRPGIYALDETPTLSGLIGSEEVLGPDIYPLIGLIERWDPEHLTSTVTDFPLRLVLKGDYDRKLDDGDVVHLFSVEQIAALEESADIADIEPAAGSTEDPSETKIANKILASHLKERSVFVRGAVRTPGAYPVSEGATLDGVLAVAGGPAIEANIGNIEITSALQGEGPQKDGRSGTQRKRVDLSQQNPADVMLEAGDSVRLNQKFQKIEDKSVLIMGEVANPGRYDLMPGDKVSDLLARAGGLTDQAYADGAIFSREAERRADEARFRSQAQNIKRALALAMEDEEKKIDPARIAETRALADELEKAEGVGRITVEADPSVLAVEPELDMLLQEGDRLFIPRRSLSVRVSGEVLSAATLQFREKKDPLDYIHEAGGFTFHADKDRTFVVYPDGSAQPLQVSAWNHSPAFIPPGSSIVVPRDPEPFDFIESAKDISQILSNLAITAIFVDDVRDSD